MKRASRLGHRLWRNNNGVGWVGTKHERVTRRRLLMIEPRDMVIRNARPLHAGLVPGSADCIGLTSWGQFLSIESKTENGVLSPEQESWLEFIRDFGGIADVVKESPDELDRILDAATPA